MTDSELEDSSDLSLSETGHSEPLRTTMARNKRVTLYTSKEKARALEECHYDPLAGYFGARKTQEKVSRRYIWKGMTKDIANYCNDCLRCKRSTAARHKPYGLLALLPIPNHVWEDVTFDFITELPVSKISGVIYDSIMVVVCRLTKMAHYIPARADWNGTELA
jgi:hypothetical protein